MMRPSSIRRIWPNHSSLRCLSRVYIVGRPARYNTSVLVTLSYQDIRRIRRMLLRWNVLSLLSCPAYVVHVSLPYINVLITQALYIAIFVFTDSLGLVHTRAVRRARVEAAFPIILLISAPKERLPVMMEPM